MSLGQVVLSNLNQCVEGSGLVNSQLSQHTAVDLNTSSLQALDEAVVGQALCAGSSVDTLNPQATEVTLLLTTVVVAVNQRVSDLLP